MTEEQEEKRKKIRRNFEVLELLNDGERRNKEVTKEKKLKLRTVLNVTKTQMIIKATKL